MFPISSSKLREGTEANEKLTPVTVPTLTPTSPLSSDDIFQTRYGYDVSISKDGGKWMATLGDVSQQTVPVVCAYDAEVETELRGLRRGPASLAKSRLNILNRRNRRVVFLGSLGLSGGGNRNSREQKPPQRQGSVQCYSLQDASVDEDDKTKMYFRYSMPSADVAENDKAAAFRQTSQVYSASLRTSNPRQMSLGHVMEPQHRRPQYVSTDDILKKLKSGYPECQWTKDSTGANRLDLASAKFNLHRIKDVLKILDPQKQIKIESPIGREIVESEFKTKIDLDAFLSDAVRTHRAVVMGLPGSGKSWLARRLAMDWSQGKWGSRLRTVFLLPFSEFKNEKIHTADRMAPSLSRAIVKHCFSHVDTTAENEQSLMQFVRKELRAPTTLLILDGPDASTRDPTGYSEAIMKQATMSENGFQLLICTRPSDNFMILDEFEVYELSKLADEDIQGPLDELMDTHPELKELARNPINLCTLCQDRRRSKDDSRDGQSSPKTLMYHVRKVVMQRWMDYQDDSPSNVHERMDAAFDTIGNIALIGLEKDRCRVHVSDLNDEQTLSAQSIIFRSGLLLQHARGDLEFPHGIQLQYFAGRRLGRMLLNDNHKSKYAESIIQNLKYTTKFVHVLAAIVMEAGKTKGKEAIRKLMGIIDGGQIEALGLQHLGLRMHILEQWLLNCNDNSLSGVDADFQVTCGLVRWLKTGLEAKSRKGKPADDILKTVLHFLKTYPHLVARSRGYLLRAVLMKLVLQWDDGVVVEIMAQVIGNGSEEPKFWMDCLKTRLDDPCEKKEEMAIRCVGMLGQFQVTLIPSLVELLLKRQEENRIRDRTVMALFKSAPGCASVHADELVEICESKDYWVRWATVEAIPSIVDNDPECTTRLVSKLLEACTTESRTVSPGVIDVLGICCGQRCACVSDITRILLDGWKSMGAEQRSAAAKALIRVIRKEPRRATEIVEALLKDDDEARWPSAYPVVKTVLEVLEDISDDKADEIVELVLKYKEKQGDVHTVALVLETIKHLVKNSSAALLPDLITTLQTAFEHEQWTIRDMAYGAAGAIAKHQPLFPTEKLAEAVTKGCKDEDVWKAQCGAFEAASELLEANTDRQELVSVCRDALSNSDDAIRERAGHAVMKVAVLRFEDNGCVLVGNLVESCRTAEGDTKHGIVHCLRLIAEKNEHTIPTIMPALIEAASSESSIVAATAVSGLLTMASSDEANIEMLVPPLTTACRREERRICFCALKALVTCIDKHPSHVEHLIGSFNYIPEPLNDQEWSIYLRALNNTAQEPREDAKHLLEKLLKDSSHELPPVKEERRAILDRLSLDKLLQWYEISKSDRVVHQIGRRFCQLPIVLVKADQYWIMRVRNQGEESEHSIDKELVEKLKTVGCLTSKKKPVLKKMSTLWSVLYTFMNLIFSS